jgi:hypothetical protein
LEETYDYRDAFPITKLEAGTKAVVSYYRKAEILVPHHDP